ncbi:uncharacterized protein LOC144058101 [Vanacampus margaritifer]
MKDIKEDQRDERAIRTVYMELRFPSLTSLLADVIRSKTSGNSCASTMENLALIGSYFSADAYNLLEELVEMTYSECERSTYNKMFLRQFVLLGMENRVPPCVSFHDMKLWLLNRSSYQELYQDMETGVNASAISILRVVWTIARCLHLNKMQNEVYSELHEEKRLSHLLGRKVTLEGLDTYVTSVWPDAQQDTKIFLGYLLDDVQAILVRTEVTTIERLLLHVQFRRATEPLVDMIIESSLDILLEELEPPAHHKSLVATLGQRSDIASEHTGRILLNTLASIPGLRQHITQNVLARICFDVARNMIQSFFQNFIRCSPHFCLMDVDESLLIARDSVLSAIVKMVF